MSQNNNLNEVRNNWEYLRKIKSKNITKELCEIAFSQSVKAIKYIPKRFKTQEFNIKAFRNDWTLFNHVEKEDLSYSDFVFVFENISNIEDFDNKKLDKFYSLIEYVIDKKYDNSSVYFIIDNLIPEMVIIKKEYSKDSKLFVIEKALKRHKNLSLYFDNFDSFYSYLDGDLENANIYDFDFDGIDLKKYNLENVNIKSDKLIAQDLYDSSFFNKRIAILQTLNNLNSIENEKVKSISLLHENNFSIISHDFPPKTCNVYYISDLHLDFKIKNRFKEHATELEIKNYISKIVKKMLENCSYDFWGGQYLIIAGDTSSSFYISSIFYEELLSQAKNKFISKNIICILGNHELWNIDGYSKSNVESVIQSYRELFERLDITFVQNELLLFNPNKKIISSDQIISMTDEDLKRECLESQLTIFGGIGFAGYNPSFNASKLIYFNSLVDINVEKKLTQEFFSLYLRLKRVIPTKKMIILSHMPKSDWSDDNYNSNWVYINGHSHINEYEKNNERIVFSDNQIGYYNEDITLKMIDFSIKCNIFEYYEDGIYEIDVNQYIRFYYKMGYRIQCNLNDGKFLLLKKNNVYMFIYQKSNGQIYILNGGRHNKLNYNSVDYYYDNLDKYSELLKDGMDFYYKYIKEVSEYVKSFGGSGKIHGAIVDIDYYNHIYVNVYDGQITPYWAESIDSKVIYPSIGNLLENECPYFLDKFNEVKSQMENPLVLHKNELIDSNGVFYEDTRMYRESRILKNIQYLIDDNIIRIWNDAILNYGNSMSVLELTNTLNIGNQMKDVKNELKEIS